MGSSSSCASRGGVLKPLNTACPFDATASDGLPPVWEQKLALPNLL